jgi:hypothetical protein
MIQVLFNSLSLIDNGLTAYVSCQHLNVAIFEKLLTILTCCSLGLSGHGGGGGPQPYPPPPPEEKGTRDKLGWTEDVRRTSMPPTPPPTLRLQVGLKE